MGVFFFTTRHRNEHNCMVDQIGAGIFRDNSLFFFFSDSVHLMNRIEYS